MEMASIAQACKRIRFGLLFGVRQEELVVQGHAGDFRDDTQQMIRAIG